MNSLAEIEKEFSTTTNTNNTTTSSKGKGIPKWFIHCICSYVLALILLFIIKPKVLLDIKPSEVQSDQQAHCTISLSKKKLAYYALPTAALCYLLVSKYI